MSEQCKYVASSGTVCQCKKILADGLCKKHRNMKNILKKYNLEPYEEDSSPVVKSTGKKAIKVRVEQESTLEDPYEQNTTIVKEKRPKVPLVDSNDVAKKMQKSTKADTKSQGNTAKEWNAFMANFGRDLDSSLLPPVSNDPDTIKKMFDSINGSISSDVVDVRAKKVKSAPRPVIKRMVDDDSAESENGDVYSETYDDEEPPRVSNVDPGNAYFLTMILTQLTQVVEYVTMPTLSGLTNDITNNPFVEEAMMEAAPEISEALGIDELSPMMKLGILLGNIAACRYSVNKLGKIQSGPIPPVGANPSFTAPQPVGLGESAGLGIQEPAQRTTIFIPDELKSL